MDTKKKEFDWFDRPGVRRRLMRALWGVCILTVVLQFTPPDTHHHGHFHEPWWVPSYAILGFLACVVMILVAKGLGYLLKRPDDYWAEGGEDEPLPEDLDESVR